MMYYYRWPPPQQAFKVSNSFYSGERKQGRDYYHDDRNYERDSQERSYEYDYIENNNEYDNYENN